MLCCVGWRPTEGRSDSAAQSALCCWQAFCIGDLQIGSGCFQHYSFLTSSPFQVAAHSHRHGSHALNVCRHLHLQACTQLGLSSSLVYLEHQRLEGEEFFRGGVLGAFRDKDSRVPLEDEGALNVNTVNFHPMDVDTAMAPAPSQVRSVPGPCPSDC